jgi:hypothetical protein
MTAKQVFKVDLAEIPQIEVTCTGCHGAIVLPIPKDIDLSNGIGCPGCNKPLCKSERDEALNAVSGIIQYLSKFQRLKEQRFTLTFSITA